MNILLLTTILSFSNPIANPRSPSSSVYMKQSKYLKQDVAYIDASLGRVFNIHTWSVGEYAFQLGAEVGFWATLGYDNGSFPLLTQDFLMAVPINWSYKNFSGALKFNHISAHLGDGFNLLVEQSLSKSQKDKISTVESMIQQYTQEDVGIFYKAPFNYSRDFMSVMLAYDGVWYKVYSNLGYAHKIIPEYLGRWFVGAGIELEYKNIYWANNTNYNQDMRSWDWAYKAGYIFNTNTEILIRLGISGFVGHDRRGQLLGRKLQELGMGFEIQ